MASKARTEAAILASIPVVPMPVDLSDETMFPEMARARRHYASLSPERKAELEREWVK